MGHAELTPSLVSPEAYLASEAQAASKHEYVGGVVYAMAGGTARHHQIAINVTVSLGTQLRGRKCRVFNSDMKVRVRFPTHTRFYYPDVQVTCRPTPMEQHFHDEPAVVVEVLSESTRRTDEHEKREAYLTITSLSAYVMLDQDGPGATVWRRISSGFKCERWEGLDATVPLPEIEAALSLAEAYADVEFPAPRAEEGSV